MAKRPSLTDARPVSPVVVPMTAPPAVPAKIGNPARKTKRGVAFWLSPAAFRQLKQISVDEGATLQGLMEEAVDGLFIARRKYPMARDAG